MNRCRTCLCAALSENLGFGNTGRCKQTVNFCFPPFVVVVMCCVSIKSTLITNTITAGQESGSAELFGRVGYADLPPNNELETVLFSSLATL